MNLTRPRFWCSALLLFSAISHARIVEEEVPYDHNGVSLLGTAVYDAATDNKRPGLILFPDWMGPGSDELERAREFAGEGYIVFVADLYGQAIRPKTAAEAALASREFYRDRDFFRKRASRAYEAFAKAYWIADAKRIAAMGEAFGGTAALELARSGARIAGAIAVNSSLKPASLKDGHRIQGRVLVIHADSDPYLGRTELHEFIDEMREGGVDYELLVYGRAQRGFMNPDAPATVRSTAYDPELSRQTRDTINQFLKQIFASDR